MRIVITGASSQIGDFLIPKLIKDGHCCYPVSRSPKRDKQIWIEGDLRNEKNFFSELDPLDVWIHIAPLYLVEPWLQSAAAVGIKRFIGFSTTSIYTKKNSSDSDECRLIAEICETENRIENFCENSGIVWTLFRPTLIYGCGRDRNVTFIQQMIARFGFFPVVGDARGLRQPVHAEDLADACFMALAKCQAANKAFNLSGGETLTYRAMVERIFQAQNKSPRIFSVPVPLLKLLIRLLTLLPSWKHINPAMVDRINQDMVFDHSAAIKDLDYSPRFFLQNSKTTVDK